MNPLELVKFVEAQVAEADQLNVLALLGEPPKEDFTASVRLPVQNELPAFQLGNKDLGSELAGLNYSVPAPLPGAAPVTTEKTIGELLTGDVDG